MPIELCSLNITNIPEVDDDHHAFIHFDCHPTYICICMYVSYIYDTVCAWGLIYSSFSRRLNLNNAIYCGNSQI